MEGPKSLLTVIG